MGRVAHLRDNKFTMLQGAITKGTWALKTLIDAATASADGAAIPIAGAKRITFEFIRAAHASGSSLFTVEVSMDGTNWIVYNKLLTNVANTNAQTPVRAASVSLAADGRAVASMDLEHDVYVYMRARVAETTDGTHTAKAVIEY